MAFYAYLAETTELTDGSIITFDHIVTNIGDGCSDISGTFTGKNRCSQFATMCHGTALFNPCAPVALLRPSGLSYAPSVMCLHVEPALLLANASDGCWGHDIKRVTKSPAGAARAVMT